MLFTVSIRVSPFETEDPEAEKLMVSALSRFSASSKDIRVRVLFSKKILAIVVSRRVGTFLIGLCKTCLKLSAVWKIVSTSSFFSSFIPNRCFTESDILFFKLIFIYCDRSYFLLLLIYQYYLVHPVLRLPVHLHLLGYYSVYCLSYVVRLNR